MMTILKAAARLVLFSLLALFLSGVACLVAVTCFEQRVPQWALEKFCARHSSADMALRIDSATFRLPRGVRLRGVRVYDRRKTTVKPFVSAKRIDLELSFARLPWSFATILDEVVIEELNMPRLPDGYYIPDSIEFPGHTDFREVNAPLDFDFPDLPSFKLKLLRPDVLSVRPERVDVASVVVSRRLAKLSGIFVQWPDVDVRMTLDGETSMDLYAQSLRGHVHGQARQPNIRPMLSALEITNCYQFIDAFRGVTTPVDATCQYDVNLVNNDLHIFLDLHPTGGSYRGVPFKDAHGLVDVRVFVRDVYQNARIVVGPVVANFPDGKMEGTVVYENTNDVGYVSFDVESTVALSNALAVADVLTDGTLDCLQPETPPYVTLKGMMAVDPRYGETNDLSGEIIFERGQVLSVPLRNVRSHFAVKGASVAFTNAVANSPRGGEISGAGRVAYPGFSMDKATFALDLVGRGIALADLGDAFQIDVGDRRGELVGSLHLEGCLGEKATQSLKGHGKVHTQNGNLATLNVLSGLFDQMEKVPMPGLSGLVAQSRRAMGVTIRENTMSFAIRDGRISSDDIVFSGGVFTIAAKGSYDYLRDELDFVVRVKIVKDDSFLGLLKNPILWPFSKLSTLLLGFRASGSLEKPVWKYDTSILNRF